MSDLDFPWCGLEVDPDARSGGSRPDEVIEDLVVGEAGFEENAAVRMARPVAGSGGDTSGDESPQR